jgi:putative endonuclease
MRAKEALGTAAIETVTGYLQNCGFTILDRCWTCPAGEIAVVAAHQRTLVACEVRVRTSSRHGTPPDAISTRRKQQLRAAAASWLTAHGMRYDKIRVDVVALLQESGGFTIEHVREVA